MTEPLTITDAAPRIRSGELTPSELLEQCLRRVDVYEPAVKAWVHLDRERARRNAERLTDEVKRGQHRGPLHGIPVGIKDIIDVFDMPTGCGSKLWANSYARRDATCVERLRQAGAVILGKTVTTPFAYLDPPPTRNPWNLDRTPGGSSSGSAAAVACGMVLAALGTQTGGSLTRPASYCGVCSLKPTHGRVSVDGVLPLAPSLDHVGVMANCVRDLALVFQVVAGATGDPDDEATNWEPVPDCLSVIETGLDSLPLHRLGGHFDNADPALLSAYRSSLEKLECGDAITQAVLPPAFGEAAAAHRTMMAVEAAEYHAGRLARRPDDYPPRIRQLVEDGSSTPAVDYANSSGIAVRLKRNLRKPLRRGAVFITPATTDFAPGPETTGNPSFNAPWSFLGLPTVSVPAGWSPDGLPMAVQLSGREEGEADLLAAAVWAERNFGFDRRLPPVPA